MESSFLWMQELKQVFMQIFMHVEMVFLMQFQECYTTINLRGSLYYNGFKMSSKLWKFSRNYFD